MIIVSVIIGQWWAVTDHDHRLLLCNQHLPGSIVILLPVGNVLNPR